jgi:hypothetical protein
MSLADVGQYALFVVVVTALVPATGGYMARIYRSAHLA